MAALLYLLVGFLAKLLAPWLDYLQGGLPPNIPTGRLAGGIAGLMAALLYLLVGLMAELLA